MPYRNQSSSLRNTVFDETSDFSSTEVFTDTFNLLKSIHSSQLKFLDEDLLNSLNIADDGAKASLESLAQRFFDNPSLSGDRLKLGVVETPDFIADLMVKLAVEQFFSRHPDKQTHGKLSSLSWFDPCVGAGAFPVAILKYYLNALGQISSADQLPCLTINDVSAYGVCISVHAISLALRQTPVTLSDYLLSGRLKCTIGDTLALYGAKADLLTKPNYYDIVIGNPPYVRSARLNAGYKEFLKGQFGATYYGSADLYTYFITSGINCLKENGVLTFISPAGFLRTKSGAAVRNFILNTCALNVWMDFDETKLFKSADVHSAVYVFQKGVSQQNPIKYSHIKTLSALDKYSNPNAYLSDVEVELSRNQGWSFHTTSNAISFFNTLARNSKPLSSYGISVYSGIRSGCTKAFIVDEQASAFFSDETKKNWLRPIVLPANILPWQGSKSLNHLIFIPHNSPNPPQEILDHLLRYKDKLASRSEAHGNEGWYKLRTCAYYDKMLEQKIIFPDIAARQRFSFCKKDVLIPDGAYFLDSADLVLLGILNSKIAKEYFIQRCSSVGSLKGLGRFRFKKEYIKDFPLPNSFYENTAIRRKIEATVNAILEHGENQNILSILDEQVAEFYGVAYDRVS